MQELEELREQAQKAIKTLKSINILQKELVSKGMTSSTISKIANKRHTVSKETLENFLQEIDSILSSNGYVFNENHKEYVSDENSEFKTPKNQQGKFAKIAGLYEMYHLSTEGNCILRNILDISAKGIVVVKGQSDHIYYGQAHSFLSSLVAINIHKTEEEEFYHQIVFNVGNYLKVSGEQLVRIFAVSTTINLDNMPMANLRVLIKIPKDKMAQAFCFVPNTKEWKELEEREPNLVEYLVSQNSILKLEKKANNPF